MDAKQNRERGTGYVFARPGSKNLWLQYFVRGERVRVSAGTDDWKKAKKELRLRTGQAVAGVHPDTSRITYEEMRASYYADYQTNGRKSLRLDGEGKPHLDKVVRLDGFFSGYEAREISTDLIRLFIADQQAKGLSNGSVNHSLTSLKRMFNIQWENGRLRDVPYFPMLKPGAPRSGYFTYAEYAALRDAMPDYLRVPLAIAFFTGMRFGEVLNLRWNQIDLLANVVTLNAGETKNGDGRIAPICGELRALLVAQRAKRQDCEFVCFKIGRGGHAEQVQSFRKAWYSSCIRAGLGHMEPATDANGQPIFLPLRGPRSTPKPRLVYVGRIFHDLRRSGAKSMLDAGVQEDTVMKIGGWKTKSMLTRYNVQSPKNIATARELLDAHNAKQAAENSHSLATVDAISTVAEVVN